MAQCSDGMEIVMDPDTADMSACERDAVTILYDSHAAMLTAVCAEHSNNDAATGGDSNLEFAEQAWLSQGQAHEGTADRLREALTLSESEGLPLHGVDDHNQTDAVMRQLGLDPRAPLTDLLTAIEELNRKGAQ